MPGSYDGLSPHLSSGKRALRPQPKQSPRSEPLFTPPNPHYEAFFNPSTSALVNDPSGSHSQLFTSTPSVFSYSPHTIFHAPLPPSTTQIGHAQRSLNREDDDSDEMEDAEDVDSKRSDTGGGDEAQVGPKKKIRVTLPRGRACVACRNRKLKCTGDRPCATCKKADSECRYEEIQRKRPRHVLLEERVVELEAMILARGEQLPPSLLGTSASGSGSISVPVPSPSGTTNPLDLPLVTSHGSRASQSLTPPASVTSSAMPTSNQKTPNIPLPIFTLPSQHNIPSPSLPIQTSTPNIEIPQHSLLEMSLIRLILPYTPFLSMPIHPQRFLNLLSWSTNDADRPHPALLYILFSESIRVLEANAPPPKRQVVPSLSHISTATYESTDDIDKAWLLSQVRGQSLACLDRARVELEQGIRNVDRPFDLVRASIGIARYLYSVGRFTEGWTIPVARLVISCGLHRMTGSVTPPHPPNLTGVYPSTEYMPKPYATTQFYLYQHACTAVPQQAPPHRMRPSIIPPPRDEIDLAERVMTFWAAKSQDWAAGTGWGWTVGLPDNECITELPWGHGGAEVKSSAQQNSQRFTIRDLFEPASPMHSIPVMESTYVWNLKSVCLLNRAAHLYDLAESSIPFMQLDGRVLPNHVPPLHEIRSTETALSMLRQRLPAEYHFPPRPKSRSPASSDLTPTYEPLSDPWYIALHINLLTAEMLTWREMTHYDPGAYPRAIACARGVVQVVTYIQSENWVYVDMIVAVNLSLVARLLVKESNRLALIGQNQAAKMASEESELLTAALGSFARWMPMAGLQALIVARVKEGLAEKDGEYERV